MWSEMYEELESLECGDFDHCGDFDFAWDVEALESCEQRWCIFKNVTFLLRYNPYTNKSPS